MTAIAEAHAERSDPLEEAYEDLYGRIEALGVDTHSIPYHAFRTWREEFRLRGQQEALQAIQHRHRLKNEDTSGEEQALTVVAQEQVRHDTETAQLRERIVERAGVSGGDHFDFILSTLETFTERAERHERKAALKQGEFVFGKHFRGLIQPSDLEAHFGVPTADSARAIAKFEVYRRLESRYGGRPDPNVWTMAPEAAPVM